MKNRFTITKTFIAVIVIGILTALAFPRFLSQFDFTRSADADTDLVILPVGLRITATRTSSNGGNVGDKIIVFYSDMGTTRSGTGAFASIK